MTKCLPPSHLPLRVIQVSSTSPALDMPPSSLPPGSPCIPTIAFTIISCQPTYLTDAGVVVPPSPHLLMRSVMLTYTCGTAKGGACVCVCVFLGSSSSTTIRYLYFTISLPCPTVSTFTNPHTHTHTHYKSQIIEPPPTFTIHTHTTEDELREEIGRGKERVRSNSDLIS